MDDNNRIKICDFGFSRKVGDAEEPMTLCGTDEWMAPEVMLGEKYDAKVCIFLLCVFFIVIYILFLPP